MQCYVIKKWEIYFEIQLKRIFNETVVQYNLVEVIGHGIRNAWKHRLQDDFECIGGTSRGLRDNFWIKRYNRGFNVKHGCPEMFILSNRYLVEDILFIWKFQMTKLSKSPVRNNQHFPCLLSLYLCQINSDNPETKN